VAGRKRIGRISKSGAEVAAKTPGARTTAFPNPLARARRNGVTACQIGDLVRDAVRTEISTLRNNDWLGPMQPVPPQAPPEAPPIRGFDTRSTSERAQRAQTHGTAANQHTPRRRIQ
jgi:hypothetical protein